MNIKTKLIPKESSQILMRILPENPMINLSSQRFKELGLFWFVLGFACFVAFKGKALHD